MDISLSPEVQRRIERTLSDGRYGSANELVLDALDALECTHEDSPEQARRFDGEIRAALNEIERGEYTDYSQEELSRVFKRARTQGLELLAKTHPVLVPVAG
jgi:Arc/MetJ-type ribon-helix-helix transcriptional regulator